MMNFDEAPTQARPAGKPPERVQVYHHPRVEKSERLADEIVRHLRRLGVTAEAALFGDEAAAARLAEQDMIIVSGGDGTMLRSGNMAAPHGVPVLGINLGRLGFLPEVDMDDWKGPLARVLVGDYWLEERMMLHAEHQRGGEVLGAYEVLNETVINRGGVARPVRLRTYIDAHELTTFVADGLIVATATGSTAYALAAGGPILPPELKNILILPISPHLCLDRAIVLAQGATLRIHVRTEHYASLNADGMVHIELQDGDDIMVRMSQFTARFVRVQDPVYFYRDLTARMNKNPSADKAK
ncbi:MAG TPA: NAD(+)/NADH kinase [Pyrinomonadaceae bacterium]|jgi:NAD+ kinase